MPHEFRCSTCNKLLRTPDGTEGMPAKCPECGAITQVPTGLSDFSPSSAAQPEHPVLTPVPPTADTPQFATGQYGAPAQPAMGGARSMEPTLVDFSDVFARTWDIFQKQWGMCLAVLLVVFAISMALQVPTAIIRHFNPQDLGVVLACGLADMCVSLFLLWITIGETILFLKIARGESANLADLFTGGPFYLSVLGASILFSMAMFGGLLLCIIPGIIVGLMFSQFFYVIVDQKVGAIESLQMSMEITSGNKWTLIAIWLAAGVLAILITVCTCGVGYFAVAPFLMLLGSVTYLVMTGQPTADQM